MKIEAARAGEKQWRWEPLRCQGGCGSDGDADDYSSILGKSYDASSFVRDDLVYVVDLATLKSEPGSAGWLARSGVVQKVECADERDARGSKEGAWDKLVLKLHACNKPEEWAGVPQVQYERVGAKWVALAQATKMDLRLDNMSRRSSRQLNLRNDIKAKRVYDDHDRGLEHGKSRDQGHHKFQESNRQRDDVMDYAKARFRRVIRTAFRETTRAVTTARRTAWRKTKSSALRPISTALESAIKTLATRKARPSFRP